MKNPRNPKTLKLVFATPLVLDTRLIGISLLLNGGVEEKGLLKYPRILSEFPRPNVLGSSSAYM